MKFARWIFLLAAIYGIGILAPGLFLERLVGTTNPPAINHPEFYYGFYGSALVWQIAFLVISRDPVRFRLLMPIAALEKLAFFASGVSLYLTGRLPVGGPFVGGLIDGVWMCLFIVAWRLSGRDSGDARSERRLTTAS